MDILMVINIKRLLVLIFGCFLLNPVRPCPLSVTSTSYYYPDIGQNICYWLITSLQNVTKSEAICQFKGGHLAFIPNAAANAVVRDFKAAEGFEFAHDFFIGYIEVGSVLTVMGTNIVQTYNNWESGQPDNSNNECVSIYNTDAVWYDESCSSSYKAVCSNYSPADPPPATTTTTLETTTTTIPQTTTTTSPTLTTTLTTTTAPQTTTTIVTTTSASLTTTQAATTTTPPISNSMCPVGAVTMDCQSQNASCVCGCSKTYNMSQEQIQQYLDTYAEEIKKALILEKSALSSAIRKKISAKDFRPSSTAMGSLGVILLVVIFGGIILADVPKFIHFSKKLYHKIRNKLRSRKSSSTEQLKD